MDGVTWALLLKPFAYFVLFVLVVAPITWVLWRLIPDGRLKVFLFQTRNTEGEEAEPRDVAIMLVATLICYALLGVLIAYLYS